MEFRQRNGRSPPVEREGLLTSCTRRFDTQDSLYDTTWSEAHENQIVVACGDGSVKLFDISLDNFPVQSWQEHNREVYSVSWNLVSKDTFASSSWDGTIKVVRLFLSTYLLCVTKTLNSGHHNARNRSSPFLLILAHTALLSPPTPHPSSPLYHPTRTSESLICVHHHQLQTTLFT